MWAGASGRIQVVVDGLADMRLLSCSTVVALENVG